MSVKKLDREANIIISFIKKNFIPLFFVKQKYYDF